MRMCKISKQPHSARSAVHFTASRDEPMHVDIEGCGEAAEFDGGKGVAAAQRCRHLRAGEPDLSGDQLGERGRVIRGDEAPGSFLAHTDRAKDFTIFASFMATKDLCVCGRGGPGNAQELRRNGRRLRRDGRLKELRLVCRQTCLESFTSSFGRKPNGLFR
jgi:hypothetical protein